MGQGGDWQRFGIPLDGVGAGITELIGYRLIRNNKMADRAFNGSTRLPPGAIPRLFSNILADYYLALEKYRSLINDVAAPATALARYLITLLPIPLCHRAIAIRGVGLYHGRDQGGVGGCRPATVPPPPARDGGH